MELEEGVEIETKIPVGLLAPVPEDVSDRDKSDPPLAKVLPVRFLVKLISVAEYAPARLDDCVRLRRLPMPLLFIFIELLVEESLWAETGAKMTPVRLPPPLVKQSGHVMSPAASSEMTPDAETATVPLALGSVIVLLPLEGVAKVNVLVTPVSVEVSEVVAPCNVKF